MWPAKKKNVVPSGGKITPAKAMEVYRQGMIELNDLIAPASFSLTPDYLRINDRYAKTFFVFTYPRYLETNWLSPLINYDATMDISMFVYPVGTKQTMQQLRSRLGQMESAWRMKREKGEVSDPELETAMEDVESLRYALQKGEVKLFQYGLYFTIYAKSLEKLDTITNQIETRLAGGVVLTKRALFRMQEGFNSTLPLGANQLMINRNLDTGSLSTTFPFVSSTLTSNEGVLYGVNRNNNTLIIFDRFSLENANSVIFGKSGGGKSYAVKLEALRSMMLDTEVIIVDPENEYQKLCEGVGGNFIKIDLGAGNWINPFDLSLQAEEEGEAILKSSIIRIKGLVGLMAGELSVEEDAIVEKALFETYSLKDITTDQETHKNEPPLLKDLQSILMNMAEGEGMARKLEKFTSGTFSGLFSHQTNIDLNNKMNTFSVRDLDEELRPLAIYAILGYVWNQIRKEPKKRMMIVDEAWWMMQHVDSAKFLYALAKRARKYYLGLTVVSQDVEDVLQNKYGKAIVSNSSMQLLLKQAPSSIDIVTKTFNLTQGERYLLLQSDVGEGLFFAGLNHAAIKIIASYVEDQMITSDPKEILERAKEEEEK